MNVRVESFGDVKVVRLKEQKVTFPHLRDFSAMISEQMETGTHQLIIDLSDVSYLDCASFGCLMDVYQLMSKRSGTVKLLGLQTRVETMANMMGLTLRMETFRDETDAIESFA
jgi:anti-anti-sigma factor